MKTFKILSVFLMYPTKIMKQLFTEDLSFITDEKLISRKDIDNLNSLITYFKNTELLELQENYVSIFDRTPSCSLHLFEHVYGDSSDRGQAMVDLMEVYNKQGVDLEEQELPDYLPLFLEFLSILPLSEALDMLGETITIIATLKERLKENSSPYFKICSMLVNISEVKPDKEQLAKILSKHVKIKDNNSLDKSWEEKAAF